MKTKPRTITLTVLSTLGMLMPLTHSQTSTIPNLPSGWLRAHPTMVQTGTHPTLTWGITFPSIVNNWVTITPPATLTSKEELDCQVRVLGAGVTVTTSGSNAFSFVPTEATISYAGGTFTRIFYGTNLAVNPNTVVWSRIIEKGKTLRFGGRYFYNNTWGTYFTSSSGTKNVRTLVNGDTPPTTTPMYLTPTLEEFIKPYLDGNGKVKIGPMDVIVFMELTHTDAQVKDAGYDLQDMVLLVTFKPRVTTTPPLPTISGYNSTNQGSATFINLDTN